MSQIAQNNIPEQEKKADGAATGPNLRSYFQRIGYEGPLEPNLELLKAIHVLHPQAIAFENLDPLLRKPVRLDLESLQQKLLQQGRGGYCFEHNLLLSHVLKELGYTVKGLAARVMWNLPEGMVTARGHMLLLVEVKKEPYLVDVGFGGQTLTAPLRLVPDLEQPTPHEPFRLIKSGDNWIMQSKVREEWKPLYRFSLDEQFQADYEVTSWYLCHFPDSHFIKGIIAARTTPEGRYALRNNELVVHKKEGQSEKKILRTAREIMEVLENSFLLKLPKGPELETTLNQLLKGTA